MEKQTVEEKQRKIEANNRYAKWALWIGIPLILVMPYVFTHFSIISFSETGQIGDTIAGTTSPVVGLVGAILVYFSFRQQLIANEIQLDLIRKNQTEEKANKDREFAAIEKEMLVLHLNDIRANLDAIVYREEANEGFKDTHGYAAVIGFYSGLYFLETSVSHNNTYWQIRAAVFDIKDYVENCITGRYISNQEKVFFLKRVMILYKTRVGLTKENANEIKLVEKKIPIEDSLSTLIIEVFDLLEKASISEDFN